MLYKSIACVVYFRVMHASSYKYAFRKNKSLLVLSCQYHDFQVKEIVETRGVWEAAMRMFSFDASGQLIL